MTNFRRREEEGGLRLDLAKRLIEPENENVRLKRAVAELTLDKQILQETLRETDLVRPTPEKAAQVDKALGASERRACRVIGQVRVARRYVPTAAVDEDALTRVVVMASSEYGRYGYQRV